MDGAAYNEAEIQFLALLMSQKSQPIPSTVERADTTSMMLIKVPCLRNKCHFEITEELVSVHSMHGTTTGIDIFREVEKSVAEYNLEWKKLKCITTDGGRNMCGTKKGLVGQINKVIENSGGLKSLVLHCILHQQALCGKHLDLSSVLDPVISTVNYIRSHGLKHRQFRDFLEEMNAEFPDLPYYTSVLLKDSEWLWKLAFSADLTMHLNDFNYGYKVKLHSSVICTQRQEAATPFQNLFAQDVILALKQQFEERFSDLDACSSKLRIFENPFNSVIGDLHSELQMEVIDLQSNDILRTNIKREI
ncbi:general transcription factor II-I repeat domain-containing protein 2B-like [Octopus sinensis]|uniref:General transcription factor II-I repeat domain-containing protein 2B-like n=1 Tax=Octopus sinensis TaxID=2607531 RepID=A0A6P7U4A4_9MOLL|nr:general transcription factor II-I repeat domain-containing protein 2B-like [Octopus sinensis]